MVYYNDIVDTKFPTSLYHFDTSQPLFYLLHNTLSMKNTVVTNIQISIMHQARDSRNKEHSI